MSRFLRQDLIDCKGYKPDIPPYNIKLDANESFLNLTEDVLKKINEVINNASFNRYPDLESSVVCNLYGRYAKSEPYNIIAGNGSDELISLIFDTFAEVNDKVMTVAPDFSMYDFYAVRARAKVVTFNTDEDFSLNIYRLIEEINKTAPKVFIFSNPNNPTGKAIPLSEIEIILQKCSCLVVVDEAYFEFNDETAVNLIDKYDNLLVLRTCSKAFGISSLRLGFALGCRELIEDMKKMKAPYNISLLTQKIGEIVLNNRTFVDNNIQCILRERDFLYENLKDISGINVYASKANYFLIKFQDSKAVFKKLVDNGILVRKYSDERLKAFLRITVGSRSENEKVISVLSKLS